MTIEILMLLLVVLLGVVLSGVFSGLETGYISLSPVRLETFKKDGSRTRRVLWIETSLKRPESIVSTCLIGTNFATTMAAVAVTWFSVRTGYISETAATITITLILVFFGEIVPKSFFRQFPHQLVLSLVDFLRFAGALFAPLVFFVERLITRVRNIEERSFYSMTREELLHIIDNIAERGAIEEDEHQMIDNVIAYGTRTAQEVMVPAIDIAAVDVHTPMKDIMQTFVTKRRSRVPLFNGTLDKIIGIVHVMDVIRAATQDLNVLDFAREPYFVPESKKIDDLFSEMRKRQQHMAIVVNEYGETIGIVTLEDIVEEIVGEIEDEHDRTRVFIVQNPDGSYIVDVRIDLDDLNARLGTGFTSDNYESFGGYLIEKTGDFPTPGQEIELDGGYKAIILSAVPNGVKQVRLVKTEPEEGE